MTLGLPLVSGGLTGGAVFSPCESYRYELTRTWDCSKPGCAFVMLNPSTALAEPDSDDPTVAKCGKYARRWGFGSLTVVNIFAWRSTDPHVLPKLVDPIGSGNDAAIVAAVRRCSLVVAAWGVHSVLRNRDRDVLALIREAGVTPHCLRVTKHGFAEHPLYLPSDLKPQPYIGRPDV